ncbi:MAG: hypothetical protein WAZ94_14580 [Phycisphaerales bacterium]
MRAMGLLLAVGVCAPAMATIVYSGGTISENFDTLPIANVTGVFSATIGTQAAIPGLTTWSGAKIAGSGGTATNFVANDGTSNSGAMFSMGLAGNGERALGALASGSNTFAFGVDFVNGTAGVLTDVTISFTKEQWRSSTATTNVLSFAYGLSGGTITGANFLSDASLTAEANLNVQGDAFVTSNGALNPPSTALVSYTITGLNWQPGDSLFIRWSDFNDTGNDAMLGIDDFGFTATPAPGAVALLGLGGLVMSRRRRA